ncbi:MAG: hypothetical protein HZA80_00110 [Candidatus Taylorbacteria bacterium]|nr:hypothetical protein [Candidatus Taylorbacteria bacterium]
MVTVAIFAFVTAFLAVKYGNATQGIIVTNLAYDVALTIRQAQTYGLNVKEAPSSCSSVNSTDTFQCAYGVYLSSTGGSNSQFIFFVDSTENNSIYTSTPVDEAISKYVLKRGIVVQKICTNSGCTSTTPNVSIAFRRPDPDAIITGNSGVLSYVKIVLVSPQGNLKNIVVRKTGQISIED